MRNLLNVLSDGSHWTVSNDCTAAEICPLLQNAKALARSEPDSPAERLERLLLLAHLRGERHMTVRDLRSGLALLLTGDIGCADVHASFGVRLIDADPEDSLDFGAAVTEIEPWSASYWNIAFSTPSERDLVLGEIHPLDPGRFAHPALERYLYFRQRPDDEPARSGLFIRGGDLPPGPDAIRWIEAFKRRFVFEGKREDGGAESPLENIPASLLPYRSGDRFIEVLAGTTLPGELLPEILVGMSRSDALSLSFLGTDLLLKVNGSTEHQLDIVKRFPASEFTIEVAVGARTKNDLVETVSRSLWLTHEPNGIRVRITLDLYEILVLLAGGLDPSSQELQPLLEELGPFKSRVQLSTTDELILLEAGRRGHRLFQSKDRIIREDLAPAKGTAL